LASDGSTSDLAPSYLPLWVLIRLQDGVHHHLRQHERFDEPLLEKVEVERGLFQITASASTRFRAQLLERGGRHVRARSS
jgi:hypothetical protein